MTWPILVPPGEDVTRLRPVDLSPSIQGLRRKHQVRLPWMTIDTPTRDRPPIAEPSTANPGKDECLAMVAHELRNSLGPMSTAAEVLNTPGVSASNSELARGILTRQLEIMTRLVNDLVDGARMTQGKMDLRRAPTDLNAVLRQALEDVAHQVKRRDQQLSVLVPAESWYVLGDTTRLEQAFGNLLNNASKFTRRGGRIWLSVEKGHAADGAAEAVVHIRDEGIGITAEMLPHVFDLFTQAGRSPHQAQGLGVGLALVRRIVDLHGGRVSLQSAGLARGSEFIVSLPLLDGSALPN
jgi:signal transduction histidine kinase